jgi:hypothetical protein
MRARVLVLFMLLLFILQGCGASTSTNTTVPASLDVTSVQVSILPSVTKLPVKQTILISIKLTAASGSNQALEYSLKGASDSYPPQTRGKALYNAFPGCAVSAIIFFDTTTPESHLVSPNARSLDDTAADWNVDITPQTTGTLTLSGEIDVQWSSCPDGSTSDYRLSYFQQTFTVYDPHPVHTFIGDFFNNPIVVGIVGGASATVLAALITWVVVQTRKRIGRRKKVTKPPHKAKHTGAAHKQKSGTDA